MLNVYIATCVLAAIFILAAEIKMRTNRNIKNYTKRYYKKIKWYKKTMDIFCTLCLICIPIGNIVLTLFAAYILYSSDLTVIKLLKNQRLKEISDKRELERLLNNEND